MKKRRQEKILEIIKNNDIETQDDLIKALRAEGYDVTQATVSRDIRELNLTKGQSSGGKYVYAVTVHRSFDAGLDFGISFSRAIISVKTAGNIIVLKTYPGMSSPVAVGIDKLNIDEILGCVAGDDTIIVVISDEDSAKELAESLKELIERA